MKKIRLLILIILLITLTGCFNYKEINDYAIVSGISIDINNNSYEIGLQIMNAKKEKENNNSLITIYKGRGKTVYQALEKIMLDSPKELYLGHNEVIVISDELLKKKDPLEYLDFFLRESQIEKDSLIINAKDNKAYDILEIITPLETIPSSNLKSSLNIADNYNGTLSLVTIDEFIYNLKTSGKEAVLPSVIIVGSKNEGEKIDNISQSNPKSKIKYTTLAYFKNNKLYDYLSSDESNGYNLLSGDIKETYINFKCDKNNYATLRVDYANINNKIDFLNKKPTAYVKINITTNLVEYNCKNNFIKNENSIKNLERKAEKKVNSLMNKAVNKLYYESNSDALGYGNIFYAKKYKEMKKLGYTKDMISKKITFKAKSKVRINSSSLTLKSIKEK